MNTEIDHEKIETEVPENFEEDIQEAMQKEDSPPKAGGTVVIGADSAEQLNAESNVTANPAVAMNPDSKPGTTGPETFSEALVGAFLDGLLKMAESPESSATVEPTIPKQPFRFTIHPLAEKFPTMPEKDFTELKESIRKYGLFEPIIVNETGQILDGRHRYRALIELGMHLKSYKSTISFEEIKGSNKDLTEEQFIYDSNIHRRHLTDDQRVMLAATFAPYFRKEGEERKAATLQKPDEPSHNQKSVDPKSGPLKKRSNLRKLIPQLARWRPGPESAYTKPNKQLWLTKMPLS